MKRITLALAVVLLLLVAPPASATPAAPGESPTWSAIWSGLENLTSWLVMSVISGTTAPGTDGEGSDLLPEGDPDPSSGTESGTTTPEDGEAGPDWDPMG